MPFLQIQDQQFPLRAGDMTLGGGGADVPVQGVDGVIAKIQLANDHVAIRRLNPTAPLTINGVALGTEPSPLLHGDKITVGRVEILFGDDKKQGGGTQVISSGAIPAELLKRSKLGGAAPKPTAATGGRLVSLVDGREFLAKSGGLTLGRDAACDVVLPGNDISRNHAEIAVSPEGYYIIDLSTNGVFVNGEKVEGTRTLGRGDVIRIGNEEFRFYADVPAPGTVPAPSAPAAAPPLPPPSGAKTAESPQRFAPRTSQEPTAPPMKPFIPEPPPAFKTPVTPVAPMGAAPPASASSAAASSKPAPVAAADERHALAVLEVRNEGPTKGKTYEIRGPLTHIGRGQHNDIVIADDSVSDTHAKIQRRDNGWFIVDVGSTNGTYVGGKRIAAETQIVGAPDVRFGGVKLMFKPTADGQAAEGRTRAIAHISPEQARRMSAAAASENQAAVTEPKKGVPVALWIAAVLLVGAAVAYFLVGR